MKKKISKIVLLGLMFSGFFSLATFTQAQLPDSSWPMSGGNALHASRSIYESNTDGTVKWSYRAGASVESSPVIGADGTIYVGSHDGYLYALNPDGTLKWKFKAAKPIYDERWKVSKSIMATPAIGKDGTIYVNSSSNYLHAVNPDGTEKWRFFVKWSNDFWNAPTVGEDGTIYIGTARNDGDPAHASGLYAIGLDGKEKWRYLEPSGVTVIPAIGADGTIYFGAAETSTNKGRIVALDRNGKKKWQFDLEQWLEGSASIASDDTIYSGSKEGNVYAINPDGTEKWRFKTGSGISAAPTIGEDGKVYIGSWDGNFYALTPNGKEKWRFDVKVGRDPKLFEGYPGKETICSTAALSKNNVLYFADVFDTVYALDTNGKELWRHKNDVGGGYTGSPAIGKDGTVYIGSVTGTIYAFGGSREKSPSIASPTQKNQLSKSSKSFNVKSVLVVVDFLLIISALILTIIMLIKKRRVMFVISLIILVGLLLALFIIIKVKNSKDVGSGESSQTLTEAPASQTPDNQINSEHRIFFMN